MVIAVSFLPVRMCLVIDGAEDTLLARVSPPAGGDWHPCCSLYPLMTAAGRRPRVQSKARRTERRRHRRAEALCVSLRQRDFSARQGHRPILNLEAAQAGQSPSQTSQTSPASDITANFHHAPLSQRLQLVHTTMPRIVRRRVPARASHASKERFLRRTSSGGHALHSSPRR